MSRILAAVDALVGLVSKQPITGRSARLDFGPTPARVQGERLLAAEKSADAATSELAALLARGWYEYQSTSVGAYERLEHVLGYIERITLGVPVGGRR